MNLFVQYGQPVLMGRFVSAFNGRFPFLDSAVLSFSNEIIFTTSMSSADTQWAAITQRRSCRGEGVF